MGPIRRPKRSKQMASRGRTGRPEKTRAATEVVDETVFENVHQNVSEDVEDSGPATALADGRIVPELSKDSPVDQPGISHGTKDKLPKLPTLPAGAKVSKRPIIRPFIASPYANSQTEKVVYMASKTPFMSAVKRVCKLLDLADGRTAQSATARTRGKRRPPGNVGGIAGVITGGIAGDTAGGTAGRKREHVTVKATGKAIPRAMNLALFFQEQRGVRVAVSTSTVDAIDDVDLPSASVVADSGPGRAGTGQARTGQAGTDQAGTGQASTGQAGAGQATEQDASSTLVHAPSALESVRTRADTAALQTRLRRVSVIELAISRSA